MADDVRAQLVERGIPRDEVERAAEHGALSVLAFESALLSGSARYTFAEAVERAGIDPGRARRLWRAMGFPDPHGDERTVTEDDVRALSWAADIEDGPHLEAIVELTRVMASALTRVAEAWSDLVLPGIVSGGFEPCGPLEIEPNASDEAIAGAVVARFDPEMPRKLIDFVARRQLHAALLRRRGSHVRAPDAPTAVGFADLVGFTMLSERLQQAELGEVVRLFEGRAHDLVTARGGRVVKMIGDEVMFTARDLHVAADIALELVERLGAEGLPPARAGLAWGPVLNRDGDCYGPVVNLASRLVHIAEPGTVIVGPDVADALCDDTAYRCVPAGLRLVRDIGERRVSILTRG